MKKADALLAMHSSSPRGVGARICCAIAGAAAASVRPAHSRISSSLLSSAFHLMTTELVHHTLAR